MLTAARLLAQEEKEEMWSDYTTKKCQQCGEIMAHFGSMRICRACWMGSCDDKNCRKHDRPEAKK